MEILIQNKCTHKKKFKMQKEVPTAPPSYEAVDVVQEFATRFEKRKQAIRTSFEKRKLQLEKQHQIQMQNLNKEENNALAQLHSSYVKWVIVEPPDQEIINSKNQDHLSYFALLFKN